MLTDRYGLPLSTGSAAARDAYVEAADLALTFYPGAAEAYDRAIAADAGFAMAHAGKAQMLAREGDVAAARARWRQPRASFLACRSEKPVTSRSSTSLLPDAPTTRSPPCTLTWRLGRAMRWLSRPPQTPTACSAAPDALAKSTRLPN